MKAVFRIFAAAALLAAPVQSFAAPAESLRWTAAEANGWYAKQPWLTGANFIPADAINQLEMWQAATFDPAEIDRELGWAQREYGMNTMRVFLHDLAWQEDPEGFKRRVDQFLAITARHGIRPVFVLFDSCWDPDPKIGPQHPPIPGVHNTRLGAQPRPRGLDGSRAGAAPARLCRGCGRQLRQGPAHPRLGRLE